MKQLNFLLDSVTDIFFDMDGTLVDSIPFHQEAWLKFLSNHGIHLKPEEFHAQNHGNIHEMIRKFFPHESSSEKRFELGEEKEITFRRLYQPHLKEIEGVSSFLDYLKAQKKSLHLSTMGDQNNIDFTLEGIGITEYFKTITGGLEVLKGKPDPEIFLKSMEKAGAKPQSSLVFEDSGGGIRSAKTAGIRVIGIASTHSKKELIEMGCLAAFSNFTELLDLLKKPQN